MKSILDSHTDLEPISLLCVRTAVCSVYRTGPRDQLLFGNGLSAYKSQYPSAGGRMGHGYGNGRLSCTEVRFGPFEIPQDSLATGLP